MEEPVVREIIDGLPPGRALDAACGTGRHAAYLAARSHVVTGVDISPGMLAVATAKLPGVDFRHRDLRPPPLPDAAADPGVVALPPPPPPRPASRIGAFRP